MHRIERRAHLLYRLGCPPSPRDISQAAAHTLPTEWISRLVSCTGSGFLICRAGVTSGALLGPIEGD